MSSGRQVAPTSEGLIAEQVHRCQVPTSWHSSVTPSKESADWSRSTQVPTKLTMPIHCPRICSKMYKVSISFPRPTISTMKSIRRLSLQRELGRWPFRIFSQAVPSNNWHQTKGNDSRGDSDTCPLSGSKCRRSTTIFSPALKAKYKTSYIEDPLDYHHDLFKVDFLGETINQTKTFHH